MSVITRCALFIVLALVAESPQALAQRLACATIRPRETTADVARRVTGDARNRYEPWFQILDPAASRFIAKAQYDHIRPGWRACIVNEPLRTETHRPLAAVTRSSATRPTSAARRKPRIMISHLEPRDSPRADPRLAI